jgi:hypothetical protein
MGRRRDLIWLRSAIGLSKIRQLLTQRYKEHEEKQIIESVWPITAGVTCATGTPD